MDALELYAYEAARASRDQWRETAQAHGAAAAEWKSAWRWMTMVALTSNVIWALAWFYAR